MLVAEENTLRERAAHLALTHREETHGPFTGATAEEYAEMILAAYLVADETRLSLGRWVNAGRRAGMSWAEIGGLIGISKQAAQQRFGDSEPPRPDVAPGMISMRVGATAFNEMAMLRAEGAKGRELIHTGALALTFQQSDRRWEHVRTTGIGPNIAAMTASGWRYVSSWFIFHYFKRPID